METEPQTTQPETKTSNQPDGAVYASSKQGPILLK